MSDLRRRFNEFVARHEVAWELTMGALAIVFVVLGFAAENAPAGSLLPVLELALTAVFAAEFGLRFAAADSRSAYLRAHWLDLVALVPSIRQIRLLRLFRLLRLVRAFTSLHRALSRIEGLLGHRDIASIGVIWLAVLVLSSFGMYVAENGVNQAVESPLDALWWGVTTMTTVGYGDIYPVTGEGRLAATVLMVLGISLFGIVTATATSLLMRHAEPNPAESVPASIGSLYELVALGAITLDEYEAKKNELLARL